MSMKFLNREGEFNLTNADKTSYLYFPICNEGGIMGSITPNLSGDSKTSQNSFLLEPISCEYLHSSMMGRNFWLRINGKQCWSVSGNSAIQKCSKNIENSETTDVTCGKLWHELTKVSYDYGIQVKVLNYCPATKEQVEIMKVTIKNLKSVPIEFEPIVAIPIYGRSADNIRDHRHVTSLLQQIEIEEDGISILPSLTFNEEGHKENQISYGIYARGDLGEKPRDFCPILEDFIGEGGTLDWPQAITNQTTLFLKSGIKIDGYEGIAAIRFESISLGFNQSKTYNIVLSYNKEGMKYLDRKKEETAFEELKKYWDKQSTIKCKTRDASFDTWLSWVGIQPTLRRIYGCSFLPHHDYGRGGRGWRDLWQDSLALLLNNPKDVRNNIINYYGGVRMDGSNATIIGTRPGDFIADRNSIVRMWMDHGVWPFITTNLYLNQTGDYEILFEKISYFKDGISHRGNEKDALWDEKSNKLRGYGNGIYYGTILEHILIQHLTAFFDVGQHNHMKLHGADWNDALDMAKENGESVAFTAAYAGNLSNIAKLLLWLRKVKNISQIDISEELNILLDPSVNNYNDVCRKQEILFKYCNSCSSYISGNLVTVSLESLEINLREKAEWIKEHIRKTEWVEDSKNNHWFNGYYDNHGKQVEGNSNEEARIMLTSQVFTIMEDTATDDQVGEIVKSVDNYLFDEKIGGYRLNSDFRELKTDFGRMFGFAYGNKENGAVFCHMDVMYAFALYKRGFVKEGYKVLHTIYGHAMDFDKSRIYPGIPEYFNQRGRGMYHYLTGAASWYMLTVLTEMFGVKGMYGDLHLYPKLVASQFDLTGYASIKSNFAGKEIGVTYENKKFKEIGDYEIEEIYIDQKKYSYSLGKSIICRKDIETLDDKIQHSIRVILS